MVLRNIATAVRQCRRHVETNINNHFTAHSLQLQLENKRLVGAYLSRSLAHIHEPRLIGATTLKHLPPPQLLAVFSPFSQFHTRAHILIHKVSRENPTSGCILRSRLLPRSSQCVQTAGRSEGVPDKSFPIQSRLLHPYSSSNIHRRIRRLGGAQIAIFYMQRCLT